MLLGREQVLQQVVQCRKLLSENLNTNKLTDHPADLMRWLLTSLSILQGCKSALYQGTDTQQGDRASCKRSGPHVRSRTRSTHSKHSATYLGGLETFCHEHILHDELAIGNDDSDGAEQRLERLRQLSTANVTRVHRDEGTGTLLQRHFHTICRNKSPLHATTSWEWPHWKLNRLSEC